MRDKFATQKRILRHFLFCIGENPQKVQIRQICIVKTLFAPKLTLKFCQSEDIRPFFLLKPALLKLKCDSCFHTKTTIKNIVAI